jgi:hypothetical protein
LGDDKHNFPKLAYWSYHATKTVINVLTNKSKNAVFTLPRCEMLVDIGLVPSECYLYGEQEGDEEQASNHWIQ